MARPAEPGRRAATLDRATDYVLAHGLAGSSLRPLAAALGTSTRMLLYDFGSKEQLIAEVLAEARRRLAGTLAAYVDGTDADLAEIVRLAWSWLTAEEQVPYLRLFFQVYVDAMTRPDQHSGSEGMVEDWLEFLAPYVRRHRADQSTVTLVVATLRGLLLDRFLTNDVARTDQALARFAGTLDEHR